MYHIRFHDVVIVGAFKTEQTRVSVHSTRSRYSIPDYSIFIRKVCPKVDFMNDDKVVCNWTFDSKLNLSCMAQRVEKNNRNLPLFFGVCLRGKLLPVIFFNPGD